MIKLELKIPPPLVGILCVILMWWLPIQFTIMEESNWLRLILVVVFLSIGLFFDLSALLSFRKRATTINPMTPNNSSVLVIEGIYKITRNPMYLGLLFLLTAWAVYLSNLYSFLILFVFILYINKYQIKPEEEVLASKFGKEYLSYKKQVRRWL